MSPFNSFTVHCDPRIDSTVSRQIKLIVAKILKYYPKVDSILLTGGFGRGEGSVFSSEGDFVPISDYDICIVSDFCLDRARFERMLGEIYKDTNQSLKLDLDVVSQRLLRQLSSDISSYELKVASRLLYGEDLRHLIPINESEISLSSGAITLCIRAISMSKVAMMLHRGNLDSEESAKCVYECSRVFTEIATAFSLLKDFYRPSYYERALLFDKFFNENGALKNNIPDLSSKVKEYTDIKLWSKFDTKTPEESYRDARRCLKPSFICFMNEYLGVKLSYEDWESNARLMYKKLRRLFLKPYVLPLLRRKHLPESLEGPLNLTFQLYSNIVFVKDIFQTNRIFYPRPLISWCLPLIKVFVSANLIFYSLDDSMKIDSKTMQICYRYLTKSYPAGMRYAKICKADWNSWQKLGESNMQAFQMSLHNRQKKPF